jgi:hypothetical protein
MPTNKWTQQPPLAGASTRTVLAERVYYANKNTAYGAQSAGVDPTGKLNGTDPAGFSDMGIVSGSKVTLTYTKEVKPVTTGIEQVRRGSYSMAKSAKASWTLEQYDIDTISILSGLSITAIGGIGGKLHLGQDDVVEKALLFVGTNKVDSKEFHHYSKAACLNWSIDMEDDARVLKVDADLYSFLPGGETVEAYLSVYVID